MRHTKQFLTDDAYSMQQIEKIVKACPGYVLTHTSPDEDDHGVDAVFQGRVNVDFKCRRMCFPGDILLELKRNVERGRVGWAADKNKETDVIVMVYETDEPDLLETYMINAKQLADWASEPNNVQWLPKIPCRRNAYTVENAPVTVRDLERAGVTVIRREIRVDV